MKSDDETIAKEQGHVIDIGKRYRLTQLRIVHFFASKKNLLFCLLWLMGTISQAQSLQNGLAGHYTFCDCSAKDVSGNNRHGTIVGNPQCTTSHIDKGLLINQTPDTNSCGQIGGQYVELPTFGAIWSQGFSVATWVRFDSLKQYQRIIDFGNSNGEAGGMNVLFGREINTDNLILESWINSDGIQARTTGRLVASNAIANGKIGYYCATISGDTMRIYVNGVLVGQKKGNPIANVVRTRNYIGRSLWCRDDPDFKGLIDDVRIYNRPLSSQEVKTLYQTGNKTFEVRTDCGSTVRKEFRYDGAIPSDSLRWNFGDMVNSQLNSTTGSVVSHTYTDTGVYTVQLIVHGQCVNDTITQIVRVDKIGNDFLGPDFDVCPGTPKIINANFSGAAYLWQNGSTSDSLAISQPGIYWLQVEAEGCVFRDSVIVGSLQKYVLLAASICEGQQLHGYSASGTYRDTFYLSNGCDSIRVLQLSVHKKAKTVSRGTICEGQRFSLPWGQEVTHAGIYNDTLRCRWGCDSLVREVTVVVSPLPVVHVTKSNDIDCSLRTATLKASGGSKYTWRPASLLNNSLSSKPVASPNTYTVFYVKAFSADGCANEDSITVFVSSTRSGDGFHVPNAFTPNGDGKNDFFGVSHWGALKNFRFTISNRWGQTVFATSDVSKAWDGCFRGQIQLSSAYVYVISADTDCGSVLRKGTVLLIR